LLRGSRRSYAGRGYAGRSYAGRGYDRYRIGEPRQRSWLYGLVALLWCLAVGFAARRYFLAPHAYGGRYFAVAASIAGAGALAAAVTAYFAPRRPYITGALVGALAPVLAGLAVFWREHDPFWRPVAVAVGLGTGILGAFIGMIVRWLARRDERRGGWAGGS
jgi:hypothetical protein